MLSFMLRIFPFFFFDKKKKREKPGTKFKTVAAEMIRILLLMITKKTLTNSFEERRHNKPFFVFWNITGA